MFLYNFKHAHKKSTELLQYSPFEVFGVTQTEEQIKARTYIVRAF